MWKCVVFNLLELGNYVSILLSIIYNWHPIEVIIGILSISVVVLIFKYMWCKENEKAWTIEDIEKENCYYRK